MEGVTPECSDAEGRRARRLHSAEPYRYVLPWANRRWTEKDAVSRRTATALDCNTVGTVIGKTDFEEVIRISFVRRL